MTAMPAPQTGPRTNPGWGEDWGNGRVAYVVSDEHFTNVWMFRKGQRVRFYDTNGNQVGPEHRNIAPALYWAANEGWIDPERPELSLACIEEVRSQLAARRMEALARQEAGNA